MSAKQRWILGLTMAFLMVTIPFVYYRKVYDYGKRLREVVPGRVYRSGQMTADGFADALERLHIKTVLNLQDDFPDPDIYLGFWTLSTIKESDLCRQLGVNYRFVSPDLISRRAIPEHRPEAIDRFLSIMDDPDNYPILIHCKAGLHRTGLMVAIYRMEYQGWSWQDAYREMRFNGFADWTSTSANDYVTQYVLSYKPGIRDLWARK